jgi:hypothetical protein
MSSEATAWAWKQAEKCDSQGTLLVLLALAEHADPQGICWPSRKTIAGMVGYDDKGSVTRRINKIKELGLVEKEERFSDDGWGNARQTSNVYRLQLPLEGDESDAQPPSSYPPHLAEGPPDPLAAGATGPPSDPATPGTSQNEPSEGTEQGGSLFPVPDLPPAPDDDGMADVQRVWDHYDKVFQPPRAQLGPNRIKGIKRALKEAPVETLIAAIDGLYEWRKAHPGKTSLETIWETFRGTGTMIERIEFFASKANAPAGVRQFPSAPAAIVSEKQKDIQRGHRNPDNEDLVGRAKGSEAWLREHGIETYPREGDGYPLFRPLTAAAAPDGDDAA